MTPIADSVRSFLGESFCVRHPEALPADASLVESGIVDSLGIYEIASFLEGRYGIEIDETEVFPENFGTIDRIVALVMRKRSARAA